jgi:hypothetical protein
MATITAVCCYGIHATAVFICIFIHGGRTHKIEYLIAGRFALKSVWCVTWCLRSPALCN